jgi:endonuclease/exonuclease/phosphatase family metal-dependent hydrolase
VRRDCARASRGLRGELPSRARIAGALNVVRLRVATLNVWAVPLFSAKIGTRMREIGRRLAALELDAIAFQEVWTGAARARLIEAGRSAGLVNAWHRKRVVIGSGLLVLSRLPIQDVDFDRFAQRARASAKDELLGGKGFARVTLRTPAGPLALVDTHLHAGMVAEGEPGVRAHRTAQLVQLAGEMRALAEPVLVVGDLNFEESDPEHAVLRGLTGLRDLAAETDRRAPTALRENPYRAGQSKGDRRIDYVLARDGERIAVRPISAERVFDEAFSIGGDAAACSDHAGVLAELELSATAPSTRAPADAAAIDLAARLLDAGAEAARRDRRSYRTEAGIGFTTALLAVTSTRTRAVGRRALLRGALTLGALTALAPSLESSLSSEWLARNEIDAFAAAGAQLASMRARTVAAR